MAQCFCSLFGSDKCDLSLPGIVMAKSVIRFFLVSAYSDSGDSCISRFRCCACDSVSAFSTRGKLHAYTMAMDSLHAAFFALGGMGILL